MHGSGSGYRQDRGYGEYHLRKRGQNHTSPICTSPTERTTPKLRSWNTPPTRSSFRCRRIKPGRYHIAFLTANKASMIEQPVVLTVE